VCVQLHRQLRQPLSLHHIRARPSCRRPVTLIVALYMVRVRG
jgi:hypothetical protein